MRPKVQPTRVVWPKAGVSDDLSFAGQPFLTARSEGTKNVRTIDPKTGRDRGGQRSGLSRLIDARVDGASSVRRIVKVTYDQKLVTYAELTTAEIEAATPQWSKSTPTEEDSVAVKTDRQSNSYVLDGGTGLAKFNSKGVLVWKFSLPSVDEYMVARALALDEFDGIYVATSDIKLSTASKVGKQPMNRLWKIQQLPDDVPPELVWTVEPNAYVAAMVVRQGKLYTLQNEPDTNQAFVRVYRFIDTAVPELEWEVLAPHPGNDIDVGEDGSIYVASEANASRGLDPRSPDTTASTIDWIPQDLAFWERRGWSWWRADNVNGLDNAGMVDSQALPSTGIAWYDSTGKGRHLYQNTSITGGGGGTSWTNAPPSFKAVSGAGRPTVFFDQSGTDSAVGSAGVGVIQSLQSATPNNIDPRYKDLQRGGLPNYTGNMFVLCAVVRTDTSIAATPYPWGDSRILFGQRSITFGDGIQFNFNQPSGAVNAARVAGDVRLYTNAPVTGGTGGGTAGQPAHGIFDEIFPYSEQVEEETKGYCLVTYISGNAVQPSQLRINGQPIDEWTSTADTWLFPFYLGFAVPSTNYSGHAFHGEVAEVIVLSDYEDDAGATQLITRPTYPTTSWSAGGDSELERLEGYLAHKFGISHIMPFGTSAVLSSIATPVDGDTVFVDAIQYRFMATPALAFDVDSGGSPGAAATNLGLAINLSGTGANYFVAGTTEHPTVRASQTNITVTNVTLRMRSKQPGYVFLTTTSAPARTAFTAGTSANGTSSAFYTALNGEHGNYPHPFHLSNGPPRISGVATPSVPGLMNDVGPILVKYDSIGDPRWAVVNPTGTNAGVGGIGYGVKASRTDAPGRVTTTPAVYSIGPKSVTPTGSPTTAQALSTNAVVRKIQDEGDTFTLVFSTNEQAWQDDWEGDEPQYHYPRMDVDKFDNLHVPVFGGTLTEAYFMYSGVGQLAEKPPTLAIDLPNSQSGHAVAVDPNVPEYAGPGLASITRAELVVVASTNEVTGPGGQTTLHQLRLVSAIANANTPRAQRVLAVAGGKIRRMNTGGPSWATITGVAEPQLVATAYVSAVEAFGKAYFTDGASYLVYDAKEGTDGTLAAWESQGSGQIPAGGTLVTLWNGRLVIGHLADDPQNWAMSKRGFPNNWDFFPAVFTTDTAVIGSDSQIGRCHDIINGLIPVSDDLLIILGDHTIQRMTGDPGEGARFDLVSDVTGGAFGAAWCKLPDGSCVFLGSRGGLYALDPSGTSVVRVSARTIEERLRNIDLGDFYAELQYNHRDEGVHLFLIPRENPSAVVTSYFFDLKNGWAPWPDEIGLGAMQVTATAVLDGDLPGDRTLVLGHGDGYVRVWDKDAEDDDATTAGVAVRIVSEVMLGPLTPNVAREFLFSGLDVVLASEQGGASGELFVSDTPDRLGARVRQFTLQPGRNPTVRERMRGTYAFLKLKNANLGERWAFEEAGIVAVPVGRQRVRQ